MDSAPAETTDEVVTGSSPATVPGARRPVDDEPDGWLESDAVDDPQPGVPTAGEPGAAVDVGDALTERERQVLAFERQWWRHAGAKEQAIRDLFGISSTRYYQTLNALLDKPAALAYDPVLVQRLRRLRATRARARGRTAR
ncbi:MAG TPA: DUF3263 domain-containing protein [Micromonosporaceae bacterium]